MVVLEQLVKPAPYSLESVSSAVGIARPFLLSFPPLQRVYVRAGKYDHGYERGAGQILIDVEDVPSDVKAVILHELGHQVFDESFRLETRDGIGAYFVEQAPDLLQRLQTAQSVLEEALKPYDLGYTDVIGVYKDAAKLTTFNKQISADARTAVSRWIELSRRYQVVRAKEESLAEMRLRAEEIFTDLLGVTVSGNQDLMAEVIKDPSRANSPGSDIGTIYREKVTSRWSMQHDFFKLARRQIYQEFLHGRSTEVQAVVMRTLYDVLVEWLAIRSADVEKARGYHTLDQRRENGRLFAMTRNALAESGIRPVGRR